MKIWISDDLVEDVSPSSLKRLPYKSDVQFVINTAFLTVVRGEHQQLLNDYYGVVDKFLG